MVSERTVAVVVWPAISTIFPREVPKAGRIIPQAFPKPSPNCIFLERQTKKQKYLLDVWKQLFRETSSRLRIEDLEKHHIPQK